MNVTSKKTTNESESKVLSAFKNYEHFSKSMLDAYVVLDTKGKIVKFNQLFCALTGKKSRQIMKAENIDHLLHMEIQGRKLTIEQLLNFPSPSRIDEVTGKVISSTNLNLILGIYPFIENDEVLGSFILIRDVTAETNLQGKYIVKATQSITDALTGLYNRAYFEDYLDSLLNGENPPAPGIEKVSLIMADIDHFKKVNDVYGHQAGDYVIEKVAMMFKENFRKTDILCRYGGEEFLAILPHTDMIGATNAAEKLRQGVASTKFEFDNNVIPLTISLGLAQVHYPFERSTEALSRADKALYHSKEHGRNQVSIHDGKDINTYKEEE